MCADALRGVTQRARLRSRLLDEGLQIGHRRGSRDDERKREGDPEPDVLEVAQRIVGQFAIRRRREHHRADGAEEERMTVGLRLRGDIGGDRSARCGAIVDDYRLAECFGEALPHDARKDVGRAAGRESDDDAQCTYRVLLPECRG